MGSLPGVSATVEMQERIVRSLDDLPATLRAHLLEHLPNLYAVEIRYHEIRQWREYLRKMILRDFPLPIKVTALIRLDEKHQAQVYIQLNEGRLQSQSEA